MRTHQHRFHERLPHTEKDPEVIRITDSMQATHGSLEASASEGQMLKEEAIDLTPEYILGMKEHESKPDTEPPQELQDVFSISQEGHNAEVPTANEHATRFRSTASELNSYFSSSFCTETRNTTQTTKKIPAKNTSWKPLAHGNPLWRGRKTKGLMPSKKPLLKF